MNRLLVVEDNPDLQVVLADYLRETFRCEVVAAATHLQVRSAVRSTPFDLALLDLLMDGTTAAELVSEIRTSVWNQETPVILMSAFCAEDLARSSNSFLRRLHREVIEIGASAYLVKPFSLQVLAETAERVVGPGSAKSLCSPTVE